MGKKSYVCDTCNKKLSGYHSLWRHKRNGICQQNFEKPVLTTSSTGRSANQEKCSSFPDITKPAKNSKVSAMIDAIINNGESESSKKIFQPTTPRKLDYSEMIGPSSDAESTIIPSAPPRKKLPVKKRTTATKPRKIDYSKMIGPSSDEERPHKKRRHYSSESDEGRPLSPPSEELLEEDNDDELPLPPGIQFLPENVEELKQRGNELIEQFERGKYKNRNEIVCILDELKRRGAINSQKYKEINDILSEKQGLGIEEEDSSDEEEEDTVEAKISNTVNYLVEHDKREIEQLLELFEKTAGTYYEEDLAKLRRATKIWMDEEIQGKKPELKEIEHLLTQLERSKILRSNLIRFETILKDIRENRIRIDNAIRSTVPLFDGSNNEERLQRHINYLAKEKSINDDQREALVKEEELNLDKFIKQLKLMKVGRGLKFLPRLTDGLLKKQKEHSTDLKEKEMKDCERKQLNFLLKSILEELLQRRAITKEKFKDICDDHNLDYII